LAFVIGDRFVQFHQRGGVKSRLHFRYLSRN
jgi:hypothetical protein